MNPFLFAALLLTAATWLSGAAEFRAHSVSGSMNLSEFPGASDRWQVQGPTGNVSFGPNHIDLAWRTAQKTLVYRQLPVDPPATGAAPLVRFSGRIERLSPAALELDSSRQSMFLVIYRRGDALLQYGGVTRLGGQFAKQRFEYLVQLPAGADGIELRWHLRSAGQWRLSALELSAVKLNSFYQVVVVLLVVAWLACLGGLFRPLLARASGWLLAAMVALVGFIVMGTGIGQPAMAALLQPLMKLIWTTLPDGAAPGAQSLLKGGHMLAFLLLTLILLRLRGHLMLRVPGVLLLSVTLATASECLQRHRFNRSPELRDVLIDSAGILLALLLFFSWQWWQRRRLKVSCADPSRVK